MITEEDFRDVLSTLNDASEACTDPDRNKFVEDTLNDLDIDADGIIEFAIPVATNLVLQGVATDTGPVDIVSSGLVLGIQIGIIIERRRAAV